jgi:hypothetical protein
VLAAETRVDAAHPLKRVDEAPGRQFLRGEPRTQIEKSCHNAEKQNANTSQPGNHVCCGQRGWMIFDRCGFRQQLSAAVCGFCVLGGP